MVNSEQMLERLHVLARSRRTASFILGLSVLYLMFALFVGIKAWIPQPISVAPIHMNGTPIAMTQIADFHLFGNNLMDGLPLTDLNLSLQGVLTAENPRQSLAIIATANDAGKVYRPGDTIIAHAVLYQVLQDKVIIEDQGKLAELLLLRPTLEFTPQASSLWEK